MLTLFENEIIVFAPFVLPQNNWSFQSGKTNGVMPADDVSRHLPTEVQHIYSWRKDSKNMNRRVEKELYVLRAFVAVNILLLCILWFTGFTNLGQKQKFDELDVERLNIVEKNGQLRAVIANTDRMPDPIVNGKAFKTERPPGMIFYNGLGDECGGLIFGAVSGNDKYGAYGGFTLDQYKQSQAIGLIYNDHTGSRQVGLSVWDRPETPISDLIQKREAVERMPDGREKESAIKSLR